MVQHCQPSFKTEMIERNSYNINVHLIGEPVNDIHIHLCFLLCKQSLQECISACYSHSLSPELAHTRH